MTPFTEVDQKAKLLIVDDDTAMLSMLRMRLESDYEVIVTTDAEHALGLALEHKPNAILLDLGMPKFSGFELCQGLRSLTYTAPIPVFIITGGPANETVRQYCNELGTKGFFTKPIDFAALSSALQTTLYAQQPERRAHIRVRMRVPLLLRGFNRDGKNFEEAITTENVSEGGFLCRCAAPLFQGATVEVFLPRENPTYIAQARVVRITGGHSQCNYGFKLIDRTPDWILQPADTTPKC